ncbi:MAG: tyrosine--tRNA ligase [Candidatus Infernicultor aquiphilus]|uniref:Tyrosine--tRNA ligase n=1 Tax=Candidatus Infernicultor aquiphilus TaxID=1805029 RepID=A0A2M7PRA8_9BACT|nr:tyrosine--tRNA ligase [bacterium]PIU25005.1 MAG: tyrosine--tRNA ligase [Candidatus Atribacteria bacterium CG08_land_8_20_14_0_20_33_29]PIW12646.1 MAG: tyrosine--tRNA ligase [Candidatus Atribacteria bacterium CG17_big_fil_post_rev_8_21_14_2_50_34_11]PIX35183.1 MAG: tyrosine--tRNA ligase [Candidatus Atribacteria bacterium CG_4_8_14_3_um_filter_34_18]PIY32827.1 MAG: tyrosine--tRNA ligase [Candidatus Atribacteria bacterium CG_4_10_14_3_um_filter_34_13]PJB57424.1 MAG: tyrosine--tRNA ligase [Cand
MDIKEELSIIKRGTEEIISEEELIKKIEKSRKEKKPLRVKQGFDPNAPDIHLGHTVGLRKMRQFQDLGHEIYFLIGDFTGRIGDPSGRSVARKQLTEEEVNKNAETYKKQVYKILNPEKTKIVFNSNWLGKLSFSEVLKLCSKYTVARMLERDDFATRYKEEKPIGIHEFLYPLMQGYDSVALQADIELGGTDQKFNLLVGRNIQREYNQEPQIIITLPLLEGTDGIEKMSKSLGNYIGINELPQIMYGKVMSIPDRLMIRYFELVTDVSLNEINQIKINLENDNLHPQDVKKKLAREIVKLYHGQNAALIAEEEFEKVFNKKLYPEEMKELVLKKDNLKEGKIWLIKLIALSGLVNSKSEARRLIEQGGVKINGEKVDDPNLDLTVKKGMVIKIGKLNFVKLVIR